MEREIDLVYLWVDGNDPEWLARKRAFTGEYDNKSDNNCSARYEANDELRYSLRSVEKYMPWVRNIFIVTDNQIPDWLDEENSKVKIINQNDILPSAAIPCYNCTVIEYFLYKIPGLSEHFIYANDDMFVNKPLAKDFFFGKDDYPIIMLSKEPFENLFLRIKKLLNLHISVYRQIIERAAVLIKRKFGKSYSGMLHHNMDAYLKSDCQKVVEEVFNHEIYTTVTNHLRDGNDVQRIVFSYYSLAMNHGHLKYVSREDSGRIRVNKPDFMKYIERYAPKLFCLNDNEHATEEDRRRIRPFLEELFPQKSSFEK